MNPSGLDQAGAALRIADAHAGGRGSGRADGCGRLSGGLPGSGRATIELVVAAGHAVRLDASEPDNLKLTTPDDLDLARRLVAAWDARHGGGSVSS